jgi:hypothetical protein
LINPLRAIAFPGFSLVIWIERHHSPLDFSLLSS